VKKDPGRYFLLTGASCSCSVPPRLLLVSLTGGQQKEQLARHFMLTLAKKVLKY